MVKFVPLKFLIIGSALFFNVGEGLKGAACEKGHPVGLQICSEKERPKLEKLLAQWEKVTSLAEIDKKQLDELSMQAKTIPFKTAPEITVEFIKNPERNQELFLACLHFYANGRTWGTTWHEENALGFSCALTICSAQLKGSPEVKNALRQKALSAAISLKNKPFEQAVQCIK